MWTIALVAFTLFMLAGWGYGAWRGGGYMNPMGVIALILLIILAVLLYRGSPWRQPVDPQPPAEGEVRP